MLAFEVYINGRKLYTAGGEDYPSLNALLSLIRLPLPKPDDVTVTVFTSAITQEAGRVASWPSVELAAGDRVEIRVVDVAVVDAPESVQEFEESDDNDL